MGAGQKGLAMISTNVIFKACMCSPGENVDNREGGPGISPGCPNIGWVSKGGGGGTRDREGQVRERGQTTEEKEVSW